jgi:hypothetical protein
MNKNIRINGKKHLQYLDKKKESVLNKSWSKWKLLTVTMKQRNVIKK